MLNAEECVQISDDDTVAEVEESGVPSLNTSNKNGYTKRRCSKIIDTIVIDDENLSQRSNNSENNNVIEIKDNDCSCTQNNGTSQITLYDNIYKENKLLASFIEKCLDLEHSEGMIRIINKNLMRVYKDCDENYKKSPEFMKVLNKLLMLLETNPYCKFSHVKNLCETLKSHAKKRAKLITLATNLKENVCNLTLKRKNGDFTDRTVKRPKKDIIIDLDDEQKDEPVINLDEYQTDVVILDESINVDEKENKVSTTEEIGEEKQKHGFINVEVLEGNNENKENEGTIRSRKTEETVMNDEEKERSESIFLEVDPIERIDEENTNNITSTDSSEENRFLVAQVEVSWEPSPDTFFPSTTIVSEIKEVPITFEQDSPVIDTLKIKAIEEQIAFYKQAISKLDEAEVCDDTVESPYIKSEKLKAKIVLLYEELCAITGQLPVKRREVRLQVREGHPSGPVRLLEAFINNNIGRDGVPPFPDFSDVVRCVIEANEAECLCWSKVQIMKEASALFTQCGRALQKRRQRREWRDLMSCVKLQSVDGDPADEDPVLLAKLEQNRRLALRKENELIERYAMMQTRAPKNKPGTSSDNVQGKNSSEHPNPTQEVHLRPIQDEQLGLMQDKHLRPTQNELETQEERLRPTPGEHSTPILAKLLTSAPEEYQRANQSIINVSAAATGFGLKNLTESICAKTEFIVNKHLGNVNANSQNHERAKMQNNLNCTNSNLQNQKDGNIDSNLPTERQDLNSKCRAESSLNNRLGCKSQRDKDSNLQDHVNSVFQKFININFKADSSLQTNVDCNTHNHGDSTLQDDFNSKNNLDSNLQGPIDSEIQSHVDSKLRSNDSKLQGKDSKLQSHVDLSSETPEVKIKKEPIDIAALLEELGDNYTASILDIEDPFLVIEISSDSSCSGED